MKRIAFFGLAMGCAFAASAQVGGGVISDVAGNVTVSSKQSVKRAVKGTPVVDGASILVSTDGKATVVMGNGCVISLKGSQHLTVNVALQCAEVQASVKQLFPAFKVAQAPTAGPGAFSFGTAGAGAGIGAGIGAGTILAGAGLMTLGMVTNDATSNDKKPASGQ